ncbi:hypothetical protein SAMN02745157_0673 [Kaistia soli DSM 19436]|uniref:Uncharacterized protein n=1 Tax=Kaistia soli DSM 19436 TaxID=1122133 RepID=A0A1M4VCY7_9HYPH|nr:hypothetical protein [Kaistia soli]SHE66864.1 hypothetical protein SAMN02745157_0673 [Kaistia soli DSM 19436]
MTARRNLDIFTSPLAFSVFCVVMVGIWAAMMLAPALLIARLKQPAIVTPPAHAEVAR